MKIAVKDVIKDIVNLSCKIIVFPLFLIHRIQMFFRGEDSSFWACSQLLSLLPGIFGNYLRKNFYALTMTRCDKDCAILFGVIFSQADTEIGKGVYIGPNCNIGKCRIEDYCTLGSNVHIMSGKQQHFFDDPDMPIQEQGGIFEKIVIGEDTWVGNCAVVMANVGKKCIIGAGSVVTKEVDDFSIIAGNPAKLIRKRT